MKEIDVEIPYPLRCSFSDIGVLPLFADTVS